MSGECNIDIQGVQLRKRLGICTAIVGLLVLGAMYSYDIAPLMRFLVTAGFGAGTMLNFLQAHERFCVANALHGSVEEAGVRKRIKRTSEELRRDRVKILSMLLKTVVTALAAGTFALLPI